MRSLSKIRIEFPASIISFVVGPLIVAAMISIPFVFILAMTFFLFPYFFAIIDVWAYVNRRIFIESWTLNFLFSFICLHVAHISLSRWPITREFCMPFVGSGIAAAIYSLFGFGIIEVLLAAIGGLFASFAFCKVMRGGDL